MTTATEILNQLGGRRFIVMTGVKNLVSDNNALQMHLPRNASKAKYLRIELNANDTYTMTFKGAAKKDFSFPVIAEFDGVYNDMLQNLFTKITGLYTSL